MKHYIFRLNSEHLKALLGDGNMTEEERIQMLLDAFNQHAIEVDSGLVFSRGEEE